jgi:hypothetical protein
MDASVDGYSDLCMKIKDKQIKSELMDEVISCKQRIASVLSLLSKAANANISNEMIAQLNDLAFKAIRKAGVQKKMDERAIKNELHFKKLDAQLKKLSKKVDKEDLNTRYKEIIERIGPCPMSQNDVVEGMIEGDCMCVCLQIGRSEATIMDPSKLAIKSIVPTFMSLDSFMESSIFNLKKN